MYLIDNVRSSLAIILSHKIRTLLTLLGIIIGVMAVVSMFSAVDGVKKSMDENIGKMGWNNSFEIIPKQDEESQGRWRRRRRTEVREATPINLDDYRMLRSELDFKYMYGMVETTQFDRQSKMARWTSIKATNNDYFDFKEYGIIKGRMFNRIEHKKASNVCLIGETFWKENMSSQMPIIGEKLTLGDNRYIIVGILGAETDESQSSFDWSSWQKRWDMKSIYIPLSTGAQNYTENNSVNSIYIQSKNENDYTLNMNTARQLLLASHSMVESFQFTDISKDILQFTQQFNDQIKKWNTILMAIATVSLLVGGIGLFSTLLISISERMNEIGIRKSIGATNFDIFMLLISEAVVLTSLGAGIGIGLAKLIVTLIGKGMKMSLGLPLQGVLIGLAFAFVIGVISGLYPAIKASKVNPIEAVYYMD